MSASNKIKPPKVYLTDAVIETFNSAKNGKLLVEIVGGKLMLNTRNANQSFDGLHQLFQLIFADLKANLANINQVLCLGLAGGSVVHILRNELQLPCTITAVEYDEVMVQIAQKHFGLQQFDNLNVIIAVAFTYAEQQAHNQCFDLILVDLFEDNKVANGIFNLHFNEQLLEMCPHGIIVINTICKNKVQEKQINSLVAFFKQKQLICNLKIYDIAPTNKVLVVYT
ncbi:MAG: spermidine synthase [Candidatus Methylacidiphilales bacterium]